MPSPSDKNRFESNLGDFTRDGKTNMKNLHVDSVPMSIDWDRGDRRADNIEIGKWGKALILDIQKEANQVFDAAEVDEAHEEEELLRVTKRAMTMAVTRYEAVLSGFEGSNISNKVEVDEFWQRAAIVLQSINAKSLMYESAMQETGPDPIVEAFYKSIESNIPADFTAVVERITTDELTSRDREYIAGKFRRLMSCESLESVYTESTKDIQTGEVALLLLNLKENPEEKKKVIDLIISKPGGPAAIVYLTMGGYITGVEAEQYIERHEAGEKDEDRIKAFGKAREFILGGTMRSAQKARVRVRKETRTRAGYILGHKNQAQAKLSYKGIGATYVKCMAGGALVLSALNHWDSPVEFMTNPVTLAALTAGSIAAEVDPSDIGVWPKPGTHSAPLFQDKEEQEDAEMEDKFKYFKEDMLNKVTTAELYYNLMDRVISETKVQLTEGVHLSEVKIDLDKIGVKYNKLHSRFKNASKKQIESDFSEWTQTFFFEEGLNRPSEMAQRQYMNDMRRERELDDDWPTYNLGNAIK